MKDPLGVSPGKGNQGTTRGKEKFLLTSVGIEPTTSGLDLPSSLLCYTAQHSWNLICLNRPAVCCSILMFTHKNSGDSCPWCYPGPRGFLPIVEKGRVGYEEFCRSRRLLFTEAKGWGGSAEFFISYQS